MPSNKICHALHPTLYKLSNMTTCQPYLQLLLLIVFFDVDNQFLHAVTVMQTEVSPAFIMLT